MFSEIDETVGEYMSPIMIIHKQGGFKHLESIRRGRNIIKNSFKIGGKMVRYNALSEHAHTGSWEVANELEAAAIRDNTIVSEGERHRAAALQRWFRQGRFGG